MWFAGVLSRFAGLPVLVVADGIGGPLNLVSYVMHRGDEPSTNGVSAGEENLLQVTQTDKSAASTLPPSSPSLEPTCSRAAEGEQLTSVKANADGDLELSIIGPRNGVQYTPEEVAKHGRSVEHVLGAKQKIVDIWVEKALVPVQPRRCMKLTKQYREGKPLPT